MAQWSPTNPVSRSLPKKFANKTLINLIIDGFPKLNGHVSRLFFFKQGRRKDRHYQNVQNILSWDKASIKDVLELEVKIAGNYE